MQNQSEAVRIDAEAAANDAVGFGRRGYELRRPFWDSTSMEKVAGKTVIITGGSNGVGLGASTALAALGARVVIVSRDEVRGRKAAQTISESTANPEVTWVGCDLASLESVRRTAAQILDLFPHIDVLLNNAGGLRDERAEPVDGNELTWATNVLGPYLLTELLSERLIESAPARVIEMTSGGAYSERIDLADLVGTPQVFSPKAVYARTKRAQIIITEERAREFEGTGVSTYVTHPGWTASPGLVDSQSMASFNAKFSGEFRTLEQGADTAVWLASADLPLKSSGTLWHDRIQRETHRTESTKETPAEREQLIRIVRERVGLSN